MKITFFCNNVIFCVYDKLDRADPGEKPQKKNMSSLVILKRIRRSFVGHLIFGVLHRRIATMFCMLFFSCTGSIVSGLVVSDNQENIPYLNIIYPCVTLVRMCYTSQQANIPYLNIIYPCVILVRMCYIN